MTLGLGYKGAILGFGEEGTWGSAAAVTKFIECLSGKLNKTIQHVEAKATPRIYELSADMANGGVKVDGSFDFEVRYEGIELLLKHAMGSVSSAEAASFTVTLNTNDKLNFNIGAAELTATLTAGTYIAGTTQATAASLCKAIYDAIVAAEAVGTYTVTFSHTTKKFTIARSAGTFQLLWNTGTNKATDISTLCGYSDAADDTGALSYAADTAVVPIYDNTFSLADDLPTGLTFEYDEDISAGTGAGGKIDTLALSIEYNNYLKASIGVVAKDKTYAAQTSATLSTAALALFTQGAVTYGGSPKSVISAKINLNNKLKKDIVLIGSTTISEPTRSAKREITGSISVYFESVSEFDDFVAATSRAIVLTFTGAAIKATSALTYTITITLPICKLTAANPSLGNEGPITLELPFKAYATDSSTKEMTIVVRNTINQS